MAVLILSDSLECRASASCGLFFGLRYVSDSNGVLLSVPRHIPPYIPVTSK